MKKIGNVHTRREGAVGIVEFDNPDGGFLTADMVNELDRITQEWGNDSTLRAIVLTGRHTGTFITHYSPFELAETMAVVKDCKSSGQVKRLRWVTRKIARFTQILQRVPPLYCLLDRIGQRSSLNSLLRVNQFHRMLCRWQMMDKVVIAAINGHCMGGGFEIALSCDFRLMARGDYALGLPEAISAIIPGSGGTQRLARLVGANRAVELILTGQLCNADEAEQLGLITRAVDMDQLQQKAMALAQQMAALPPLSVGGVKRSVSLGSNLPMKQATELETLNFLDTCISNDAAAAADYYLKKLNAGHHPTEMFDQFRKGGVVEYQGN